MAITAQGLEQLGFTGEVDFKLENVGNGFFIKEWLSGSPQPSVADIEAAHVIWQAAFDAKAYYRARVPAYDEVVEQLDQLYHDMAADKGDKTGEWFKAVKKVKDDNPKP